MVGTTSSQTLCPEFELILQPETEILTHTISFKISFKSCIRTLSSPNNVIFFLFFCRGGVSRVCYVGSREQKLIRVLTACQSEIGSRESKRHRNTSYNLPENCLVWNLNARSIWLSGQHIILSEYPISVNNQICYM